MAIIRRTARFTVKEEAIGHVLEAIASFLTHTATEPGTLTYESLRSTDEPTRFLHLMTFADEDAERVHASSAACERFTSALYPACTDGPVFERWAPAR
jgi:quinol monooxygenase YgiN